MTINKTANTIAHHKIIGVAFCGKGFEYAVEENIKELVDAKNFVIRESHVLFEVDNISDLCYLSYRCQAASKILLFIDYITHETIAHEKDSTNKTSLSKSLSKFNTIVKGIPSKNHTFRINHFKVKDYDEELEKYAAEVITQSLSYDSSKLSVDLKNPGMIFYVVFAEKHFLALDLSGDISKRDYRIFNSSLSLKGTNAFGLLKLSGYKRGETLLDPLCNSATICIEAALYDTDISVRKFNKDFPFTKLDFGIDYEKFFKDADSKLRDPKSTIIAADPLLRNITAAKKNAKVAGVEKFLDFRRIDFDWMDIKFDKKSINRIITFIPGSSGFRNVEKSFKELFYQCEYILKDTGRTVVLCIAKDLLITASSEYFVLEKELPVYAGSQLLTVLFFKKKTG